MYCQPSLTQGGLCYSANFQILSFLLNKYSCVLKMTLALKINARYVDADFSVYSLSSSYFTFFLSFVVM